MIRFLIRTAVFLGSAAVGLIAADLLLDDFSLDVRGFVIDVVIFAALQSVLSPFILKVAVRNASALVGAVGLISTFVALVLTNLFGGLTIVGAQTWLLATLIVWIVTMIATLLLPLVLVRRAVHERSGGGRSADPTRQT